MSSGEAAQRLFFVVLTVLLFLLVPILRWGLVTNYSLLGLTCACGVAALGLPALLITGRLGENASICIGRSASGS